MTAVVVIGEDRAPGRRPRPPRCERRRSWRAASPTIRAAAEKSESTAVQLVDAVEGEALRRREITPTNHPRRFVRVGDGAPGRRSRADVVAVPVRRRSGLAGPRRATSSTPTSRYVASLVSDARHRSGPSAPRSSRSGDRLDSPGRPAVDHRGRAARIDGQYPRRRRAIRVRPRPGRPPDTLRQSSAVGRPIRAPADGSDNAPFRASSATSPPARHRTRHDRRTGWIGDRVAGPQAVVVSAAKGRGRRPGPIRTRCRGSRRRRSRRRPRRGIHGLIHERVDAESRRYGEPRADAERYRRPVTVGVGELLMQIR